MVIFERDQRTRLPHLHTMWAWLGIPCEYSRMMETYSCQKLKSIAAIVPEIQAFKNENSEISQSYPFSQILSQ